MSVAGLRYGAALLGVELLEAQEAALRKAAAERRVETPSKETVEEDEIPITDAPPRTPPRPGSSTTESRS